MKIGISLPYDFFSDAPSSKEAMLFKEKLGEYQTLLPLFRELGVSSIELRGVSCEMDANMIKQISEIIWDEGLNVSIHSSLPKTDDIDGRSFFKHLEGVLPIIGNHQNDMMINIHSYLSSYSYEELFRKSVQTIDSITEYIETNKLPIKIAIEHNRGKNDRDPSTTYDGLLSLFEATKSSSTIGFCWDFGHAYSNHLNGRIPLKAPDLFANGVTHTHIHGVGENDKTHSVLSQKNMPLEHYVGQLVNAKYDGIYNLELNAQRIVEEKGMMHSMTSSIDFLKKTYLNEVELC